MGRRAEFDSQTGQSNAWEIDATTRPQALAQAAAFKEVGHPDLEVAKGANLLQKTDIDEALAGGHITKEEHAAYTADYNSESEARDAHAANVRAVQSRFNDVYNEELRRHGEEPATLTRAQQADRESTGTQEERPVYGGQLTDAEKRVLAKSAEKKQKEREEANRGLLDEEGNALPQHEIEANAMAEYPKHPGDAPKHPGENATKEELKAHGMATKEWTANTKAYDKSLKAWKKKWGAVLPHLNPGSDTEDLERTKPENVELAELERVDPETGKTGKQTLEEEAKAHGVRGFIPLTDTPLTEQAKTIRTRIQKVKNQRAMEVAAATAEAGETLDEGTDAEYQSALERGEIHDRPRRGRPAMPGRNQRALTVEEEHTRLETEAEKQRLADERRARQQEAELADPTSEASVKKSVQKALRDIDTHTAWLRRHGVVKTTGSEGQESFSAMNFGEFANHVKHNPEEFPGHADLTPTELHPKHQAYLKKHKKVKQRIQDAQRVINDNRQRDIAAGVEQDELGRLTRGDVVGYKPGEKDRGGITNEDLEEATQKAIEAKSEKQATLILQSIYKNRRGNSGLKVRTRSTEVADKLLSRQPPRRPGESMAAFTTRKLNAVSQLMGSNEEPNILCNNTDCWNTTARATGGMLCSNCDKLPVDQVKPRVAPPKSTEDAQRAVENKEIDKFRREDSRHTLKKFNTGKPTGGSYWADVAEESAKADKELQKMLDRAARRRQRSAAPGRNEALEVGLEEGK